ncbi:MAG: tol-pal system protein YbgF, partial [Deltaproteobacteria bacterium]|nr:tol-pal system protein YbgF [Deltaproteobacteria bacterium]
AEGDSIRREFDHLRGMVEEREHRLSKNEEAIELLKGSIQAIDDQLRKLGKGGLEVAGSAIDDIKKSLDELVERIERLEKAQGIKPDGAGSAADPKALYNDGLDAIREKKNYKKGAETLERFVSEHPKHALAGNAQYWIGEAYYALGDFERSIAEFNRVITKYPKSDKVPASLLKQGYSFEKLKESENALIIFKSLVEKHPKSAEAATAKKRVAELEKAQKKKTPAKTKKEGTKSSK